MQRKKYQPVGIGMTPSTTEVGIFLRSRRLELGITQDELARRIGMRQNHYSALERGALGHKSLRAHLRGLTESLRCDPSELQKFIPHDPQPQTALGKLIHERREELNITAEDLAARADLTITTVKILEYGERGISDTPPRGHWRARCSLI